MGVGLLKTTNRFLIFDDDFCVLNEILFFQLFFRNLFRQVIFIYYLLVQSQQTVETLEKGVKYVQI